MFYKNLTLCSECQIDGEDFVIFVAFLKKRTYAPYGNFFTKSYHRQTCQNNENLGEDI